MIRIQRKSDRPVMRRATIVILSCAVGGAMVALSPFAPTLLKPEMSAMAADPVDPAAVAALRRMGTTLRSLKAFAVKVEGYKDEVMDDGEKIQFSGSVRYVVRSPDRFRADIETDRKQRKFQYNGKTLTLYAPRMKYYAVVPAPPTVGAMLDTVRTKFGVELPVADLFLWGTPQDGVDLLTSGRYIGPAFVNGTVTDHYAFRQKGVDWQIWIERGDKPLPRKLVITTVDMPSQPQYLATLTWNLSPVLDEVLFNFTPPPGTAKIDWTAPGAAASIRRAK